MYRFGAGVDIEQDYIDSRGILPLSEWFIKKSVLTTKNHSFGKFDELCLLIAVNDRGNAFSVLVSFALRPTIVCASAAHKVIALVTQPSGILTPLTLIKADHSPRRSMVLENPRRLDKNHSEPAQSQARLLIAASTSPIHLFSHLRSVSEPSGSDSLEEARTDDRTNSSDEPQNLHGSRSSPDGEGGVPQSMSLPPQILITHSPHVSDEQHIDNALQRRNLGIDTTECEDDQDPEMSTSASFTISIYRTNEDVMEFIHDGIEYARECYRNQTNPRMTRSFEIPLHHSNSAIISLLRRAQLEGLVTLIRARPKSECYEVGFRPPQALGYPYATIADPHWWAGKSAGEIKAGPMASKGAIREAKAAVRRREGRLSAATVGGKSPMSAAQRRVNNKLEEGLRRQNEGLRMYDSDGEDTRKDSVGDGFGASKC